MGPDYARADAPMPAVPEGADVRDVIADALRAHQRQLGRRPRAFDTDAVLRLSQYNLFPNATVLVWARDVNVLVARPGPNARPGRARDDHLVRAHARRRAAQPAVGRRPVPPERRPRLRARTRTSHPRRRCSAACTSPASRTSSLSSEECRIINMHRTLEEFLGLPSGGRLADRA